MQRFLSSCASNSLPAEWPSTGMAASFSSQTQWPPVNDGESVQRQTSDHLPRVTYRWPGYQARSFVLVHKPLSFLSCFSANGHSPLKSAERVGCSRNTPCVWILRVFEHSVWSLEFGHHLAPASLSFYRLARHQFIVRPRHNRIHNPQLAYCECEILIFLRNAQSASGGTRLDAGVTRVAPKEFQRISKTF